MKRRGNIFLEAVISRENKSFGYVNLLLQVVGYFCSLCFLKVVLVRELQLRLWKTCWRVVVGIGAGVDWGVCLLLVFHRFLKKVSLECSWQIHVILLIALHRKSSYLCLLTLHFFVTSSFYIENVRKEKTVQHRELATFCLLYVFACSLCLKD